MTKAELITKLEELLGEVDCFLEDSTILSAPKDMKKITDRFNDIIAEIEDEVEELKLKEEE